MLEGAGPVLVRRSDLLVNVWTWDDDTTELVGVNAAYVDYLADAVAPALWTQAASFKPLVGWGSDGPVCVVMPVRL